MQKPKAASKRMQKARWSTHPLVKKVQLSPFMHTALHLAFGSACAMTEPIGGFPPKLLPRRAFKGLSDKQDQHQISARA